jgi:hypothetical protein
MVGRWAIIAIAVPVVATVVRKIGQSIERRHGQTRLSSILGRTASGLDSLRGRKESKAIASGRR